MRRRIFDHVDPHLAPPEHDEPQPPEHDDELVEDLRLFLQSALRMLADQPPYSYAVIGTPWWDGAVAISGTPESELGGDVATVRAVLSETHRPLEDS